MLQLTASFIIGLLLHLCFCSTIDNALISEPIVDCSEGAISMTFKTEKPFNGRAFVKGLSEDDDCSSNFITNSDQTKFSLVVSNGACSMQQRRVVLDQAEGVVFTVVIVVSFHGMFITKADRAFRCMCFFRFVKHVSNTLDVSMIPTTELLQTAHIPTCTYTIRSETPNGPLVRYAKVGEKLVHIWSCDDVTQGFLVHSCWVGDGRGNRFDLLDVDGCAIDPIIQPDAKYDESLTQAYAEALSYKFADVSVLAFECTIEFCKKVGGECSGLTPPRCGQGRKKRALLLHQQALGRSVLLQQRNDSNVLKGFIESDHKKNQLDVTASIDVLETLGPQDGGSAFNSVGFAEVAGKTCVWGPTNSVPIVAVVWFSLFIISVLPFYKSLYRFFGKKYF